jgi:hypothetical protein
MTLSTAAEVSHIHDDAMRPGLRYGRARGAVVLREISDASGDSSGPSDSEPDPSSDDNECSSEDELDRSCTRKNIPWDEIDEQRLLVYNKEGKPWKWIFQKFLTRTPPAVRTRLDMIKARAK